MSFTINQTSTFSSMYQTFFSKKLLPYAVQDLVLDQFGARYPFPKEAGAKTMTFVRPDAPGYAASGGGYVQTLTEGTPISVSRVQSIATVLATLVQYGEVMQFSDILTWTNLYNMLEIGIKQMGGDAALHLDTLIRNVISPTTAVTALNRRYGAGAASWATIAAPAAGNTTYVASLQDLLDCMTRLTLQRAPKKDGSYVMICSPPVARDLMNDNKFILTGQYGTSKGLLKGEVGTFYGVRVVVATNPWVEDGASGAENTYAAPGGTKDIYTSYVLGTDAFGIPALTGQTPYDPQVRIVDKPDRTDPLGQYVLAGWKAFWVCVVLNNTWMVQLRTRTGFA